MSHAGLPDLAVVLAGGGGRRLGGVDKSTLVVGGSTLLERALRATAGVEHVVVVGSRPPAPRGDEEGRVRWTREDPPGGGPAAGLLAGLAALDDVARDDALALVLAVDMPWVSEDTAVRLARAARADPSADGAVLRDHRVQPLCAAYRRGALRAPGAAPDSAYGMSVRALVSGLRLVEVPAVPGEAEDLDTWADVARATDR